jgi:arsenate reductase
LLEKNRIPFVYREYRKNPLSEKEIRSVLRLLKVEVHALLRKNDKAFKELALTGDEKPAELIKHMARHPTLLQRPIGMYGGRAVVGRPPEKLLDLVKHPH